MARLPFYQNGLRFHCTGCGDCCTNMGEERFVYLTDQDVAALSRHLGLSKTAFRKQYVRQKDGHRVLRETGKTCRFLKRNGECRVYEARPLQCRTYPFWPENLKPEIWRTEIKKECEGVGKGPRVPAQRIQMLLSWDRKERYKA